MTQVKNKILEGTEQLFMRLGVKSLTMDEICLELGISKKTLYQHFKDKQELVEQTLQHHLNKNECQIKNLTNSHLHPIDELLAINKMISAMLKNVNPTLTHDIRRHYADAWGMIETHKNEYIFNSIRNNLLKGIELKVYREDIQVEVLSRLYLELVEMTVHPPLELVENYSLHEIYNELFNYHMHGILSPKGFRYYQKLIGQQKSIMRYILLFVACLGFILSYAQTSAPDAPGFQKAPEELKVSGVVKLTLADALTTGKKNSPGIKNAILDVARAHQQVREIQAIGLPQVNASLGFNYNAQVPGQEVPNFMKPIFAATLQPSAMKVPLDFFPDKIIFRFGQKYSTSNSITMSQLVFDGTYLLGLKAAKEFEDLSKISLQRSETEALNNIAKAYALVWFLQQNEQNLKNSLKNLDKTFQEMNAIYNQGLIEKLDVDRMALTIANVKSQLESLVVMKENAFRLLKFQMGMDLNETIELADDFKNLNQASTVLSESSGENSFKQRPEYRLLEKSILLNQLNIKRYKVGYLPSVAAFATHQQNAFSDELKFQTFIPGTIIGLSVNIPVFDGFRKDAQSRIAKIDLDKSLQQKAEFENALRMDISSQEVKLKNALSQLSVQEENARLASQIYETVKKKYEAGISSSFELISADNDIRTAQSALTNAQYEVLNAQIDLKKALGKTF